MTRIAESHVEEAALDWLESFGFAILGPDLPVDGSDPQRSTSDQVLLPGRLEAALRRLNSALASPADSEALRKLQLLDTPSLVARNRAFHRMLVNGVDVEVPASDGRIRGERVQVVDFDDPDNNDWLAVNQVTVTEGRHHRRPDIVIFVNGLPLAVIELKNPADEDATVHGAYKQLQTYKAEIPSLLACNELLIISDGCSARLGTLTGAFERFAPWRTVDGDALAPATMSELEVLIRGVFDKRRFLDLIRRFIVFEDAGGEMHKKVAGYHQFHAARRAVDETVKASQPSGDGRVGVVWHTQGSGKSLTMAFYAGMVISEPAMENPTIVVITDRNDLDDQLFGTFSRCHELLRQKAIQVESRADLREELAKRASGGVIFTTVQKFFPDEKGDRHPLLSERRNIVVIADEAHRSQYDFIAGFARHLRDALPNASFIGFTATPLERGDRNTLAVFGDYIDRYDIERAVADGATVPIYYESRLAKLELAEAERPRIDPDFEEVTEGEEIERKEKLKSKWAQLEAIVGAEKRIKLIARDLVEHFEERQAAMDGKAMIVGMSRRICVELYDAIVELKPEWGVPFGKTGVEDDSQGVIKVVMTGRAEDGPEWQPHIRNKQRRKDLAERFKKDPAPDDPWRIVIVRDMWLTGFDVPSLHTMYVDKPMRGHGLMQTIARVNRVWRDKPGGLVVDYLGLADDLRRAMRDYTESGGEGRPTLDQKQAVGEMMRRYEIVRDMWHGFDLGRAVGKSFGEQAAVLREAMDHILAQEDGKTRYLAAVAGLNKAFALSVPNEKALAIRDEVGFFQLVRAQIIKSTVIAQTPEEDLDHAIRQIVSRAIAPGEVIDIFQAAGLPKPDISILDDTFLAEVRALPQRNLAVELLARLLKDEIRGRSKRSLVQSRSFAEMLEQTVRKYQNRAIETAQVIEELIELAKEMREADARGVELGLTTDEKAFYDALETNESAVRELGDPVLTTIARELTTAIHKSVTIDWTVKESVRAEMRAKVKRILRKHGYPPDKQEKATQTVLEQAQQLASEWAEEEEMPRAAEDGGSYE